VTPGCPASTVISAEPSAPTTACSAVRNVSPVAACLTASPDGITVPGVPVAVMLPVAATAGLRVMPRRAAWRSRYSGSAVSGSIWRAIHSW